MKIGVIIPCYKVRSKVLDVIKKIGPEVSHIIAVDDCCPEKSGEFLENSCEDTRLIVLRNEKNQGVGGAMIAGYRKALELGCEICVKIDGDGQMNPELIPQFVEPILAGQADYTKGNRFFHPDLLEAMPSLRIFGNTVLSFVNKLASGYWDIMDPTNGYTAIHHAALSLIHLEKLNRRFFFESDMLFRLNVARAVVKDIPMMAVYQDEVSNLKIKKVILLFPFLYLHRTIKRITFNYFLRDFNIGSLSLIFGFPLLVFGTVFGLYHWSIAGATGVASTAGTVMLAALPVIVGFQLLLFFLQYDLLSIPRIPIAKIIFDSIASHQQIFKNQTQLHHTSSRAQEIQKRNPVSIPSNIKRVNN